MFSKIELLDKKQHAGLIFKPAEDFRFARDLTSAPVSFGELSRVSKYYPILFPLDSVIPQALLAFKKGENLYIDVNGQWNVPYVPAHLRRYPFVLAKDQSSKAFIGIDRDAPHFQTEEGTLLFSENGEPSKVLSSAIEFLKQFQMEIDATEKLLAPLEEYNVLIEKELHIEVKNDKSVIRGFRVVDIEKLNQLEESLLGRWVKTGLMGVIYAHIHSLNNLQSSWANLAVSGEKMKMQ